MKNDKLYTVNKWNQPAFMRKGNVFDGFGNSLLNNPNPFGVSIASPTARQYIDWGNPFQRAAAIGTSAGLVNGFSSIANTTNPFNNSGTTTAQPTKGGSALTGILGAIGGTAGNLLGSAIGGGYSTGGVGEGVAGIGNMIGGAMQAIPGVGALAGTAVQFASGLIGGAINRGWGVKENKENIEAIKQNTVDARNVGNAVGGAATNEDVLTNSGMMTTGSGFSAGDLYKNGWWTSKGTKKGNELIRKENAALAYQNHGLVTGANNADNNMDSDIMRNFAAYGGIIPIGEPIGSRTDNMGAIEYGFMNDWLTAKREKNKRNDFVGKPQNTLLALGGDLQNHGADWSTGLVTIGAGGTHEENPNDGVQMGVDPQGVPNLVEENETVWNDYVFSNRIYADGGTLAKFHLPKKKKITYAEISKKLEKEIAERPNDPISIRGFETQMSDLADEQERQKAEMEAARAREAFEALSPEEQVALMEEASARENLAAQAEQEQAVAQQAMQQPSPEEAAMIQQQMMQEQAVPEEQMAYGGNLFAGGGDLALNWLKENNDLNLSDDELKSIASAMGKYIEKNYPNLSPDSINMKSVYSKFFKGWSTTPDAYGQNYRDMRSAGISKNTALKMLKARKQWNKDSKENDKQWETIAAKWEPKSTSQNNNNKYSAPLSEYKVENGKRVVFSHNGVLYPTAEAANKAAGRQKYEVHNDTVQEQAVPATAAAPTPKNAVAPAAAKETKPAQPKAAAKTTSDSPARNVGTWKQEGNHWNEFGLPGLQDYVIRQIAGFDDLSDEDKVVRRQEIIDAINGVQQSYIDKIVPTLGSTIQNKSDEVGTHQKLYNDITGNSGFKRTDNNGNIYDAIGQAINKPQGHDTGDTYAGGWVDGYAGPQTWLRHMGASGDALDNVVKQLKDIGIDYSPYNSWTIGEGDNAKQLYRASIIGAAPGMQTADKSFAEEYPMIARPEETPGTPRQSVAGQYGAPWAPENAGNTTITPTRNAADAAGNDNGKKIVPNLRAEWPRYAGLFGPAVGLGMQLAGVGRPNYSGLDAALDMYDRAGTKLADYKTIGNYLTYRPMDIWAEQNRLNANSRGTERAILNSGANQGAKMAGLLAAGYNDQIASGELYRKALEYNDAKRQQVATFNRGTDQFNAEAYNRAALQNATAMNSGRSTRAQLATNIAGQKLAGDAGWYNSLYGNVGGIFKGIGDLGRENADRNQIARLVVSGAIPGVNPDNAVFSGYAKYAAKGGKLKKNKRRGLTF